MRVPRASCGPNGLSCCVAPCLTDTQGRSALFALRTELSVKCASADCRAGKYGLPLVGKATDAPLLSNQSRPTAWVAERTPTMKPRRLDTQATTARRQDRAANRQKGWKTVSSRGKKHVRTATQTKLHPSQQIRRQPSKPGQSAGTARKVSSDSDKNLEGARTNVPARRVTSSAPAWEEPDTAGPHATVRETEAAMTSEMNVNSSSSVHTRSRSQH